MSKTLAPEANRVANRASGVTSAKLKTLNIDFRRMEWTVIGFKRNGDGVLMERFDDESLNSSHYDLE